MRTEILAYLQSIAEAKYRQFSLKLLPKDTKLLGVRIPLLRQYAKTLLKEGRETSYLNEPLQKLKYQEEFMLYAMLLAQAKIKTEDKLPLIKNFIPYINSWAVCDIFCADLKEVKQNRDLFYETFKPLLTSRQEYQIRFFYVLALSYFITPEYLEKIFALIKTQTYTGYYDKMAVAWFLSMAYVKFPEKTEKFLFQTPLDDFIFRKSISKICDSYQVTKEVKVHLKTLASAHKI